MQSLKSVGFSHVVGCVAGKPLHHTIRVHNCFALETLKSVSWSSKSKGKEGIISSPNFLFNKKTILRLLNLQRQCQRFSRQERFSMKKHNRYLFSKRTRLLLALEKFYSAGVVTYDRRIGNRRQFKKELTSFNN
jgi:hypothetical protein